MPPTGKTPPDLVERQMHRWDRIAEALKRHPHQQEGEAKKHPVITVSGTCGSGREDLSVELARELNYDLYGRELVEKVAEDLGLNKPVVEGLDERVESEIRLILATWMRGREIESSDYMRSLVRTMVGLANSGGAIILGRGGAFVLEPLAQQVALSVRLDAPLEQRVTRIMTRRQIGEEEARRFIDQNDRDQAEFVRHHFQRDIDSLTAYDLTLNMGRYTTEQALNLVLHALTLRGHNPGDIRRPATA